MIVLRAQRPISGTYRSHGFLMQPIQGVAMRLLRGLSLSMLAVLLLLDGCATRPINPPITQSNGATGYTLLARQNRFKNQENLVVLAFSGGGTRAAAFSYGVLEFLRRTQVLRPDGTRVRLLDAVDVITGVSGGSFTALAYGEYGRQAVRRLRATLPEAQHPGRACRPCPQPAQLGTSVVDGLGPFRVGGPIVRRGLVQWCDLRRPRSRQWPAHPGLGNRHLDRYPDNLQSACLRFAVLESRCGAALPRRRRIVRRPRGALARHDQQLRRHLQLRRSAVGQGVYRIRKSASASGAGGTRDNGTRRLPGQRRSPIYSSCGWWRVRQPGHARGTRATANPRSLE